VSGFGQGPNAQQYKDKVNTIISKMNELLNRQNELTGTISSNIQKLSNPATGKAPQQGTSDRFYQRKEPTVLLGNIKSGWDADFSDKLQVRLKEQTITSNGISDAGWSGFQSFLSGSVTIDGKSFPQGILGFLLPSELQAGALALCMEFYSLRTSIPPITSVTSPQVIPWFHNENTQNGRQESRGRDLWQDTQPWKPLFVEWEAVYFHIAFDKWKFREYPGYTTFGNNVVQYVFYSLS
jgi:hypothetical protein